MNKSFSDEEHDLEEESRFKSHNYMNESDSERHDDRKEFKNSIFSENRNVHSGNKSNYNPPYKFNKDNHEEKSKKFSNSKNDYRHHSHHSNNNHNRNSNKKRRHEDDDFRCNNIVWKY